MTPIKRSDFNGAETVNIEFSQRTCEQGYDWEVIDRAKLCWIDRRGKGLKGQGWTEIGVLFAIKFNLLQENVMGFWKKSRPEQFILLQVSQLNDIKTLSVQNNMTDKVGVVKCKFHEICSGGKTGSVEQW